MAKKTARMRLEKKGFTSLVLPSPLSSIPTLDPEEMRRRKERERDKEDSKARATFLEKARRAGFDPSQARFLWSIVGELPDDGWDGKVGL